MVDLIEQHRGGDDHVAPAEEPPGDADAGRAVPENETEARIWLEALMKSHGPRLGRYFNYKLRDEGHAQDLVTETFYRAWKSRHTFRGEARASTWLWTIAHRTLAAHYKKRSRRAGEVLTDTLPDQPDEDARSSVSDHAARKRALLDCMSKLGEHIQRCAELVWLLGHSFVEAGELLDESPDTIRMRLKRARKPLQQCLADHGIISSSS